MLPWTLLINHGICTGVIGFVNEVIYKEGQYPTSLPIVVVIHFLNWKTTNLDGCVQITPIISSSKAIHRTTSVATKIMLGNYNM